MLQEFYVRRIHWLITSFIINMPLKVLTYIIISHCVSSVIIWSAILGIANVVVFVYECRLRSFVTKEMRLPGR